MKKLIQLKKEKANEEKKEKAKELEKEMKEKAHHENQNSYFQWRKSSVEEWEGLQREKRSDRVQKELSEFIETSELKIQLPNPRDFSKLYIYVCPKEGHWKFGKFQFEIDFPCAYPYDTPSVICKTSIFHPNFDEQGRQCLSFLDHWSPLTTLSKIAESLLSVFKCPELEDPLNIEAALLLQKDELKFDKKVQDMISQKGG